MVWGYKTIKLLWGNVRIYKWRFIEISVSIFNTHISAEKSPYLSGPGKTWDGIVHQHVYEYHTIARDEALAIVTENTKYNL